MIRFHLARVLPLALVLLLLCLPVSEVCAYRGQYAVEFPETPKGGACEMTGWLARSAGDDYRLATSTLECGLGPFALTTELGRERLASEWASVLSAALMWTRQLGRSLRIGLQAVVDAEDATRPHQLRLNLPVAWSPTPRLSFLVNLGRELVRGAPDRNNFGLAIQWSAHRDALLHLERSRISGDRGTRYGLQWQLDRRWAVDLSRTHQHPWQGDRRLTWWTIGLIHQWGRLDD